MLLRLKISIATFTIFRVEHICKLKKMEAKEKVLEAMKQAGAPVNAGRLVDLTGLDRKEVDKAMKQLKAEGQLFRLKCVSGSRSNKFKF
jgi:predicted transcriptional regulator